MLKHINPLLHADLLYALRSMGHGDELILCDTNYPADAAARKSVFGRLLRIDNTTAAEAAGAILSVMPLDQFVDCAAWRMEVDGASDTLPEVQAEVQSVIDQAEGRVLPMGTINRFAFYERAQKAYCIVATGETRLFGCFVFKKGIVPPK